MNMWAVSELPVYSVERDARRKAEKKSKYSFRGRSNSSATVAFMPASPDTLRHDSESIRGLLEPAIDGPPSPETLRALSNQMKQSSGRDKHQSHHTTTSSGSSSLRSLASADRPSWENALEGISLSRKSSGRSVVSNMPSRDRPESVQIFGKTIFGRRGKLKRGDSAPTSSASSSIYSAEGSDTTLPPAPTSAPIRDSVVPAFFGRRRTATLGDIDEGAVRRKFNISGPYNFQHVAHTQKDNLPDLQRSDRAALVSEFSQLRVSQAAAPGTLKGIRADDLHFADFSSDFLPLREETEPERGIEPHTRINRPPSGVPKQFSPPRRLLKHSKSQEQMRVPPPRPPRSPVDSAMLLVPTPPVPPPRVSSRSSIRPDGFDSLGAVFLDIRPQTSGGFRHVQPFPLLPEPTTPPATSHGYIPSPEMNTIPEHGRARAESFPNDGNWPLPCPTGVSASFDISLPGVPEEDETVTAFRQSRASLTSNASLRGSQSVPMLRPLSIPQDDSPRRPASNTSDTLGRFDLLAAERALKASLLDSSRDDSLTREAWEDDIDYCYDHEAEADCDFAWERPSLEMKRDCESTTPVEDQFRTAGSCEVSPAMLTPAQFDVPALSPVSQISSATAHEAITPTLALPRTSNFSLPRTEPTASIQLLHARKPSDASSFKESHGFTLSPSLLIPNDYQQQMLAAEADAREYAFHPFDEPALTFDETPLHVQYRTSASTTGTVESAHSSFEKHVSAASSATDFTRLTASTSSLDADSLSSKPEPFPAFEVHIRGESKSAMPTLRESEEMGPAPPVPRKDPVSRSSESNLLKLAAEEPAKRKDSILVRRQRARTTSLSTPPPPNQYALFPSAYLSGPRI